MKLSLLSIPPLIIVFARMAYMVAPLVDQLTLRWFVRDLDIRPSLIANTIQKPLLEKLATGHKWRMQ